MCDTILLENTIIITEKCAKDLFENAQGYEGELWWSVEDVTNNGKLYLDTKHYKYSNSLHRKKTQEILKKHKIEGQAYFVDFEKNSRGKFWGYCFDGQGNFEKFKGKVVWGVDRKYDLESAA